jgi:hypothetical protein
LHHKGTPAAAHAGIDNCHMYRASGEIRACTLKGKRPGGIVPGLYGMGDINYGAGRIDGKNDAFHDPDICIVKAEVRGECYDWVSAHTGKIEKKIALPCKLLKIAVKINQNCYLFRICPAYGYAAMNHEQENYRAFIFIYCRRSSQFPAALREPCLKKQ